MAASDALIIVEDWISEHYFTSDEKSGSYLARVSEVVKQWKADGDPSPLTRFTSRRTELLELFLRAQSLASSGTNSRREDDELAEASLAVARFVLFIAGFITEAGEPIGRAFKRQGTVHAHHVLGDGSPLIRVGDRSLEERPLLIALAKAATSHEDVVSKNESSLLAPVTLHEGTSEEVKIESVAAAFSHAAIQENAPELMLALAGRYAILTSSDLWPQGRYLVIDLQTVAERNDTKNGGEVQRALVGLAAECLAPDSSGELWWRDTREKAVENAVGVSADLRDGVRASIEVIANEVVKRRREAGLPPLEQKDAQPLALEALRYLYRILFVLHAEANSELGILPAGQAEYAGGYSIDRLREMTLRRLGGASENGTYLFESLERLFTLVNKGHMPRGPVIKHDEQGNEYTALAGSTLRFENLEADLFSEDRTARISEVKLGNAALQNVLRNLMLSKETKGRERGFISYVALGINQLGAVYESLMSYRGSFATEDLVEVAKDGDPSKGSWVVPAASLDESLTEHRVMVRDESGEEHVRRYAHGEFVFRLSGRERQQSASYYSPEVLTRFTVRQGLEELLDPIIPEGEGVPEGAATREDTTFDGTRVTRRVTSAEEILRLSVCEPALGSGAFAIEAVRQLAEEYLQRRQAELGERIDPEEYPRELQKVKAYIALHNVYGVDLNPTAVELAEVSLWLDSMSSGLKAPWFGLRLRAGNSLIGARRATYTAENVLKAGEKAKKDKAEQSAKKSLKDLVEGAPDPIARGALSKGANSDGSFGSVSGQIFHFLLPGEGWGAAGESKTVKQLAPEGAKNLRKWARSVKRNPTKEQVARLERLTQRVEELFLIAFRRLEVAEENTRRSIDVWGFDAPEGGAITRAEVEASLADRNSAYQRVRLVMDAWCALWFWPVEPEVGGTRHEGAREIPALPTFEEWLSTIEKIVGTSYHEKMEAGRSNAKEKARVRSGGYLGDSRAAWNALDAAEVFFSADGAANLDALEEETPWLAQAREIACEQRFFHWELEFASAFERGGFDFQVGNPPWVQPKFDEEGILSDFDPWWALAGNPSEAAKKDRREKTLAKLGALPEFLAGAESVAGTGSFVGSQSMYPELKGAHSDLYRTFMSRAWASSASSGVVTLLHPPTHFTDEGAYLLRGATYPRLRRHWRIRNEIELFHEVGHPVEYSMNVYVAPKRYESLGFLMAMGIFHPSTIEGSLRHDGSGPLPGSKDENGKWSLAPHQGRILTIDMETLRRWHEVMENGDDEIPVLESRMLAASNATSIGVLTKLARGPIIGNLNPISHHGWQETSARRKGYYERKWGSGDSWKDAILKGPNLHIANPLYQSINRTMAGKGDYTKVDLEELACGKLPVTEYKPVYVMEENGQRDERRYDAAYGDWVLECDDNGKPTKTTRVRDHYRIMWRRRAGNRQSVRTLISSIMPPGSAHVHPIVSMGFVDDEGNDILRSLGLAQAAMSSLLSDLFIRSTVSNDIYLTSVERTPAIPGNHPLAPPALLRVLRLNCLTSAYAQLWNEIAETEYDAFRGDAWAGGQSRPDRPALGDVPREWDETVPLRRDEDRRQALVELDAIMAHVTGVSIDELATIYRTQFDVLRNFDHGEVKDAYIFDAHGRQIPSALRGAWKKAGRPETEAEQGALDAQARTVAHPGSGVEYTYELPFRILDREADMREAYAAFARRYHL
ncbi:MULTISPECIES: DNA methyltransferase [Dermabacter]|uniref:site-specific DNA-methyltransferase (adenine-specific) n=1 Tax=Dermabacter vaginalis TaxID=1630135 RepID=A0ABX6A2B8_9MICO|nr:MULTISPECIES: DNA methyltransferase [Dermabacter]QEU11312.1 restriction endonuclease [Dermabacter vaginalis]RUP86759.1 restriction endonuclease [Dermabacter sp. HSID17554]